MRALMLIAALMVTSACCGAAHSPAASGVRLSASYQLFTHCGVQYVDFQGQRYYADPPNPPGAWGNPYDDGTLTVIDPSTVVFTDSSGNRATFTTLPSSGVPQIQPCD